jgi:hypothetical protein
VRAYALDRSLGRKAATLRGLADVAQLVEHFTRNEGVPGSSPGVGFVTQVRRRFLVDR